MSKPSDMPIDTAELDVFESWFRTRLPDSPPSGVERIKHRVQLAVHEEALKRTMPPLNARGATERIKRGVRDSLSASPSRRPARANPAFRLSWWSGVAAVAAALGFAFILTPRESGVVTPDDTLLPSTKTTGTRIQEDVLDLSVDDDDLDDAVASLEESLNDLETSLAEGWAATSGDLLDPDAESDEASPPTDGSDDKSGWRRTPGEFFAEALDLKDALFGCAGNKRAEMPPNSVARLSRHGTEVARMGRDQEACMTSLLKSPRRT